MVCLLCHLLSQLGLVLLFLLLHHECLQLLLLLSHGHGVLHDSCLLLLREEVRHGGQVLLDDLRRVLILFFLGSLVL